MSFVDKWKILESTPIESGINTIRFSEESILEIYLATDQELSHMVLIHLSPEEQTIIQNLRNDNLELSFWKERGCLIIKLLDPDFSELFDDLIMSLTDAVKNFTSSTLASKVFVETYVKWSVFFLNTSEKLMSKRKVLGLWGELDYLLDLVNSKDNPHGINKYIESWIGPYDSAQDFNFVDKTVEIKTKLSSSSSIHISSEYQLQPREETPLELAVISVKDSEIGYSLKDLFSQIKTTIVDKKADLSLLLSALSRLDLNERRLSKYDHMRFLKTRNETFNCNTSDFPRLINSELPESISAVKYSLDIRQITSFRVSDEVF
ncbi:PD-(D/E)XK motif protein [Vibrio mediterranei]